MAEGEATSVFGTRGGVRPRRGIVPEVSFLVDALQLLPGSLILDVGSGTGRHSVELAKKGYAVTGIDRSSEMLFRAEVC